jgi:hypothetical protein
MILFVDVAFQNDTGERIKISLNKKHLTTAILSLLARISSLGAGNQVQRKMVSELIFEHCR